MTQNDASDRKWFDARDLLLGRNYKVQNVQAGAKLATESIHPDALYLTEVFHRNGGVSDYTNWNQVRQWLTEEDHPTAMAFRGVDVLCYNSYLDLHKSALMGNSFAQVEFAKLHGALDEQFSWAQLAIKHNERDAFLILYNYYNNYTMEHLSKKEHIYGYLRRAAELGNVEAQVLLSHTVSSHGNKREQIIWLAAAAKSVGNHRWDTIARSFAIMACHAIEHPIYNCIVDDPATILQIGKCARGWLTDFHLFNVIIEDQLLESVREAVKFYETSCERTHMAINSWTIIARRNNLVRDLRRLIGEMIWKSRDEALYPIVHH